MPSRRLPPNARKILVASIGVASVSYVVACSDSSTSGNLVAPPPTEAGVDSAPPPTSGNLVGPPPVDSGPDTGWDATSGNLVAPDAGDASVEDASDASDDGSDAAGD